VCNPNKEGIKEGTVLVQMIQRNYKGCTKREVLQAKEVGCAQTMLENLSKKDYPGI
jgi:hypothetical protein